MNTKSNSSLVLLVAIILGVGFWLRNLQPGSAFWAKSTTITLYFSDGRFLFPVSRRMAVNDELPRATLQALLDGPAAGSGLKNLIPAGVAIRSFQLVADVAQVDLSDVTLDEQAMRAIVETMTRLTGINSVALSINGKSVAESVRRAPLLYYPSLNGLVALPVSAATPRAALEMYLSGPAAPELTRFPRDLGFPGYAYSPNDGALSLKFAYTPSIRTLALDKPEHMRMLLLGLIATLTEFPEVRSVKLDFGGQSRLGLGRCSDLLGAPQPRPALLNDERLL